MIFFYIYIFENAILEIELISIRKYIINIITIEMLYIKLIIFRFF